MTFDVRAKRVYEPAEVDDGYRVLIDHVWPRGVSRERARLDAWARELAPSDELRTWFDHDAPGSPSFAHATAASSPRDRTHGGAPPTRSQRPGDDRLRRSRSRTQQCGRGVRVAARRLETRGVSPSAKEPGCCWSGSPAELPVPAACRPSARVGSDQRVGSAPGGAARVHVAQHDVQPVGDVPGVIPRRSVRVRSARRCVARPRRDTS